MKTRHDVVVVGSGLAGLMSALELRPLSVALVSYRSLGEWTSSAWAQGGIAAAVGDDDSPSLHAADTVAAGAGLVEKRVAARLAADAPEAIERIVSLGVRFDREDATHYALGREGAHSRRRILRAGGDATGAELVRALVEAVRRAPSVVPYEGARACDLLLDSAGRAAGVLVRQPDGTLRTLEAGAVVLATGGLGGLYRFTTNPPASRGTGIAIAARAGARLADLEFVQFHPTALDVACDPLPLVTEALRGEGALLVDERGARIMAGVHPALELAPRDVVARRVFAVRREGGRVYLDARALGERLAERFPTVFAACREHGLDPRREPIPIVAAAHYHMGGIAVDLEGRTNVPGLYACGEVAASGVHGANRLASNSLLESVVYPERIARDVKACEARAAAPARSSSTVPYAAAREEEWSLLRAEMYASVGVERDAARLRHALQTFRRLAAKTRSEEVRDAATVAALVATSALRRRETRGSHVRLDHPGSAPDERCSFVTLAEVERAGRSA
ncbi:MAG: L-aspartate oxidase [Candidatus Baltobacteraceae bacterium]